MIKRISALALFLLFASAEAFAQAGPCGQGYTPQCTDDQTITTSPTTITVNSNGGLNVSLTYKIAGSPLTVSLGVKGCTSSGVCTGSNIDTYTTVANAIRTLNLTTPYNYFSVTASWTGGTNVSIGVHTNVTTALVSAPGAPAGAAGGDLAGTYPNPTVAGVNGATIPASETILCSNSLSQLIPCTLAGTTSAIGGAPLLAGVCATGTVSVAGASAAVAAGAVIVATPQTFPGSGFDWGRAYLSATDVVTVQVCADVAGTPTSSAYNVKLF